MFWAQNFGQIGSKISDLYSGMHFYTKRPNFCEIKKVHFGLTFCQCTIASAGEYVDSISEVSNHVVHVILSIM